MKYLWLIGTLFIFSGCVRARVLEKSQKGITISHSDYGQDLAFKMAQEYCASVGKTAKFTGSFPQYGSDSTSNWDCE